MNSNEIIRKMKSSITIRRLGCPYMTIKKKISQIQYEKSSEPDKIRTLKNIHTGKRCFVLGNGPSLTVKDLDSLKGEITIASNRIYELFDKTSWRPTYYIAEDIDGIAEMIPHIKNTGVGTYILPLSAKKYTSDLDNVYYGFWSSDRFIVNRYNDKSSYVSEDISKKFCVGYTVTFSAIQFAIYAGIKEIYLLGVDFNYSVVADEKGRMKRIDGVKTYFDGKERMGSYLNYNSTLYAYEQARKYSDSHDIKIYNATRGGKLEVFERVNIDEILRK